MLANYHLGETVPLKIDVKNAAGAYYDPDSAKITIYGPDGAAVVTDATMTRESEGVYYYNHATDAASDRGCYRAVFTTVYSGATTKGIDYFTLYDPAAPAVGWSVITLADQLRAEMDQNADAAGGKVPDRVAKIVREKGLWLFDHQDWLFRIQPATLSVAAGETEVDLPADFKKLHQGSMRVDDAAKCSLIWTENPSLWQQAKQDIESGSRPRIACVYYTAGAWKAKLWPASEEDIEYPYWYLKASPWSGASPIADNVALSPTYWPEDFNEGWYALCAYHLLSRFRADDSWKGFKSEFDKWLKDHNRDSGNETISDNMEPIEDCMLGFQSTASAMGGWIPPGGYVRWYGSV